jgi:hypothetical protein
MTYFVIVLALQRLVDPLALIGGSPRTESVLPFTESETGSPFFGAPLSAMRCGSAHRPTRARANSVTPLMKPGALLAFGPHLLDTATRT